ncbi:hypothetical protein AMAG_00475 [Allomyces macrogynus ATCC 38327]|uniref:Uncharacterized protein n=1 Tax=Allomyces macrogynus (strain ATCC 38327) TaxID=578462 RepID=A0A0L0RW25_ALLM3|nr:hypothetical protein AMAG_00475 [Allomyces macrogynus ATCC 38327]|eukprot:KNE54503.1 hypothetical protein AMAG_00475 [Allomyces macrogynus ATCC 38327]
MIRVLSRRIEANETWKAIKKTIMTELLVDQPDILCMQIHIKSMSLLQGLPHALRSHQYTVHLLEAGVGDTYHPARLKDLLTAISKDFEIVSYVDELVTGVHVCTQRLLLHVPALAKEPVPRPPTVAQPVHVVGVDVDDSDEEDDDELALAPRFRSPGPTNALEPHLLLIHMDDHDVSTQPAAEQLTLKVNLLKQSVESCRASVAAWYPKTSHAKVQAPAILWAGAIMSSLARFLLQPADVPVAVVPTPDQVLAAMIKNRGQIPANMTAPSLADTFGRYAKETNLVVAGRGMDGVTSSTEIVAASPPHSRHQLVVERVVSFPRPRRMAEALSLTELRLTSRKVGQ